MRHEGFPDDTAVRVPELRALASALLKKPPTGSQWPAQTPLQTLFAATARKARQTAPRAPSHLFPNYGSPVGATENSTKEPSQIQASPSQLFQTPMFAVGVRGSLNKPTAPAASIWLRYPTPFTVAPAASSTRHRRKGGVVCGWHALLRLKPRKRGCEAPRRRLPYLR